MATPPPPTTTTTQSTTKPSCPYLDTIQRTCLDFDLERTCSVTLQKSSLLLYACLQCGKYFRGKGPSTPAYLHAVSEHHYVYVNLHTARFYCLPDNYEICNEQDLLALRDIQQALQPTFDRRVVESGQLDANTELRRDLSGRPYLPGFVGLNNLHKTDFINVTVQALAHVPPLRDYFLLQQQQQQQDAPVTTTTTTTTATTTNNKKRKRQQHKTTTENNNTTKLALAQQITQAFGQVVCKLWSQHLLKSHVDPHALVHAICQKYPAGQQQEVGSFLKWFLHQLQLGLLSNNNNQHPTTLIQDTFQGKLLVTTRKLQTKQQQDPTNNDKKQTDDRQGSDDEMERDDDANNQDDDAVTVQETTMETNFLQLTLEIPQKPLFRDQDGGLVIPQEPVQTVLQKFDGTTFSDVMNNNNNNNGGQQRRRYQLLHLPDYLILHLARFTQNKYNREKNPTIVTFPVKNLDLSDYVVSKQNKPPSQDQVKKMSIKELKDLLKQHGQGHVVDRMVEKEDLVEYALDFCVTKLPDLLSDKYDLIVNITHTSPSDVGREEKVDPLQAGTYKCHVCHSGSNQWFEIQDLHVQECMPQQVGLSESLVLILERKSARIKRLEKQEQLKIE